VLNQPQPKERRSPLLKLLAAHTDPLVRAAAASGLTFDAYDSVTVALVEALSDSSPRVQEATLDALGLTARDRAVIVPACIKHLKDRNPRAWFYAATTLCFRGGGLDEAAPVLAEGLNSSDPQIRIMATNDLRDWGPENLIKAGVKL
jgi:HEAT repeat protein